MWIGPLLAGALLLVPQSDPDRFADFKKFGFSFRYIPGEITRDEAERMTDIFLAVRTAMEDILFLDLGVEPTITVRLKTDSKRYYFTDGQDQITILFPNPAMFRPAISRDPRLFDVAIPTLVQLWLFQRLDAKAGLAGTFERSISDYLKTKLQAPENLSGNEIQVWQQFEQFYGAETTSFILNALLSEKIDAHRLPDYLRRTAIEVTEDPSAGRLLDPILPPMNLFGRDDREPSEALGPQTTLRYSRMELFNSIRLIDQVGEEFSMAMKIKDFEGIFEMISRSFPDRSTTAYPPTIHGVDLWRLYYEYRPRVQASKDNIDYYLVLREFFSCFQDRSLTLVTQQGTAMPFGVLGITLAAAEGRVYVAKVTEDLPPAVQGVTAGMELVEIDGRPLELVWAALTSYMMQYGSCSSEVEARARALNMILTGEEGSKCQLKLVDQGGDLPLEHEFSFTREPPRTGAKEFRLVESEVREDGVGVIRVNAFVGNSLTLFSSALDQMIAQPPKGLIIDLRNNSNGEPRSALTSLNRLLKKKVTVAKVSRRENPLDPRGIVDTRPITAGPIPNLASYDGPCAVLINSWTAGPAELFALGFQNSARGPLVGEQTAGAVNQAVNPPGPQQILPRIGVRISLTAHQVLNANGGRLQGMGVLPDVPYEPNPELISSGKDEMLELAARTLLSN